ncbi:tyrosine-type recombinase/integrase [Arthrobacter sp. ZGTC212]|uniref:tyrosine-type recombinase/integrase n=1 Tax=Arthrobacter sp. ZGTC212 TaxID=2058899 RepID=UPI000CE5728B|nr:site-specific integrase [Arthrobacter sp. ZGTC212]
MESVRGVPHYSPTGPRSGHRRVDQPHSLRHTFATIALDSGTALHDLQDRMGHSDPRTTRRYDRARNNLAKSAGYDVAKALA